MSESALIIFFKNPEAGKVKTRLMPLFSAEECMALYACFVDDIFRRLATLNEKKHGFEIIPFISGGLSHAELAKLFSELGLQPEIQRGSGLGERMNNAFEACFNKGFRSVVILGTDSPDVPDAYLTAAMESLQRTTPTCVIGAADDGGFYLFGTNTRYPQVFHNVEYSSADTYRQTLKQLCALPAEISLIPRWYDVDEPEDVRRLFRSEWRVSLPKTWAFLNEPAMKEKINTEQSTMR
jgi:uncharacterized protein